VQLGHLEAEPRVRVQFEQRDRGFDAALGGPDHLAAYLRRSVQFGIRVDRPELTVPTSDVARVIPLGQLEL